MKKIGRRYKSQFEESKTKLDESEKQLKETKASVDKLEKQVASQKAAPPQPDPATVAKVGELEQKVQGLTEVIRVVHV
ncbi:unnamed protein product [marine sediment metagenome]|uniref:Uncharacterized protein n=1 Tax=marine sediment metagenome TaxID=412755 RepID=X1EED7_9ZZZZ